MLQFRLTHRHILSAALLLLLLFCACRRDEKLNTTTENTPLLPDSLSTLGTKEWETGNYQKALEYYTIAYKKYSASRDEKQMANVLNNMGLVNWSLHHNKQAMEYFTEAAEICEKHNLKRLLGLTYTNRALIYKQSKEFDKAFAHNNKAIKLFKELNSPRDLAIAYNNEGQFYRFTDKPDRALAYYKFSLDECQKANYKLGMATALQNMATIYTSQGKTEKAFEAAKKSLTYSIETKSKVRISEAYYEVAAAYENLKVPDSALYYYKMHFDMEMDLLEANQSEHLSRNLAELTIEAKNLRIKNLQNEKEIAKSHLIVTLFGILAFLLIGTLILYSYFSKMNFRKRQLETELFNSKRILEIREEELRTYMIDLSGKNAIIQSLQKNAAPEPVAIYVSEEEIAELLEQKILTDDNWENFKARFKDIYPVFFNRIRESGIQLTEAETRLLVLMRLDLNSKDMANILGISPQSVRVCKMRLKKRLPAEKYASVEDFLADLTK
jgi:tetratricopeptide (TPR) repeat protein